MRNFAFMLLLLLSFSSCANKGIQGDTNNQDSTKLMQVSKTDSLSVAQSDSETFNSVETNNKKEIVDFVERQCSTKISEIEVKENCFIVISKKEQKLYVCEDKGTDTVRVAQFPVCMGKNKGQKEKMGDMKTPESGWKDPFTITEIKDASTWCHNFGDGRGDILAYGNWFMRLSANGFSGIGIHGSTNNEETVPGRHSEGCIRLLDDDMDNLKKNYAFKGMRVVVKSEDEGLKPFELKYY